MRHTKIVAAIVFLALFTGRAPVFAQSAEIESLSAVVDGAFQVAPGKWGAAFWISVTDPQGKAIQEFDAIAIPTQQPEVAGVPRGGFRISTELCGNLPTDPPRYACKWVSMTVQSVEKTAAPEVGVYKVSANLDESELDENYLGKAEYVHPFLVKAVITKMTAPKGEKRKVATLASAQTLAILPKSNR